MFQIFFQTLSLYIYSVWKKTLYNYMTHICMRPIVQYELPTELVTYVSSDTPHKLTC